MREGLQFQTLARLGAHAKQGPDSLRVLFLPAETAKIGPYAQRIVDKLCEIVVFTPYFSKQSRARKK